MKHAACTVILVLGWVLWFNDSFRWSPGPAFQEKSECEVQILASRNRITDSYNNPTWRASSGRNDNQIEFRNISTGQVRIGYFTCYPSEFSPRQ